MESAKQNINQPFVRKFSESWHADFNLKRNCKPELKRDYQRDRLSAHFSLFRIIKFLNTHTSDHFMVANSYHNSLKPASSAISSMSITHFCILNDQENWLKRPRIVIRTIHSDWLAPKQNCLYAAKMLSFKIELCQILQLVSLWLNDVMTRVPTG